MKINSVNYTNSILKNNTERNNKTKNHPNFGNIWVTGAAFIENNGFMGEFLTIDTCGMGIPRAGQGYARNMKELGHLNYKAGHEEVRREVLSGPAFFFVPLIVTTLFGIAKGKSAMVKKSNMELIHNLIKKSEVNLANGVETKKNFVKTVIKEAFGENPKEKEMVDQLSNLLEKNLNGKFSITDSILNLFKKDKVLTRKELKEQTVELLTKLNKANEEFLDNAGSLKVGEKFEDGKQIVESMNVQDFLTDSRDYLSDFTNKAAKTQKEKSTFIEDFKKQAMIVRSIAEVASIGALSAFITYIPKLYQTGENFPGKDGLVKNNEQTANNKPSETKTKEAA